MCGDKMIGNCDTCHNPNKKFRDIGLTKGCNIFKYNKIEFCTPVNYYKQPPILKGDNIMNLNDYEKGCEVGYNKCIEDIEKLVIGLPCEKLSCKILKAIKELKCS